MNKRRAYQRRHPKLNAEDRRPPRGFDFKRYEPFRGLTSSRWADLLSLLRCAAVRWKWTKDHWTVRHPAGGVPAYIGPPPLMDDPLEELQRVHRRFGGTRIVLLNLAAADESILGAIEVWLHEQREFVPYPIGRRGPRQGTKASVSRDFLRSLEDHQIIALTHLERSPENRTRRYSNKELGRFLYPNISPEAQENKIIKARKLRDEALQLVPVFAVAGHRN